MAKTLRLQIQLEDNGAVQKVKTLDDAQQAIVARTPAAAAGARDLANAYQALGKAADTTSFSYQVFNDHTTTLGKSATQLDSNWTRAHQSFTRFDGILASVGIHMAPEIRAMAELGEAAGKTAGELGLVTTAGLVLGAAVVGWKIGRAISEFFDLDNAIGNTTAKLLGWGDLVSQVSGAQQDVMTRAIERGAAATITYGEALAFNDKWLKEHNATVAKDVKAYEDWKKAMEELNSIGEHWQGTLDTIDGETVEAVKWALEGGAAQGVLATAYALTNAQVKAVASSMAAATAADKAAKKDLDLLIEAYEKLHLVSRKEAIEIETEMMKLQEVQLKRVNAAIIAEFEAQVKLNAAQGLDAAGAIQVQTTAAETLRIGLEQLHQQAEAGISQKAQEQVLTDAFTKSLYDEAVAYDTANAAAGSFHGSLERGAAIAQGTAQAFEGLTVAIAGTTDQMAAYYAVSSLLSNIGTPGADNIGVPSGTGAGNMASNVLASIQTLNRLGRRPGTRASGGPVSSGSGYWVGERGPEWFSPAQNGTIIPNGGGGLTINVDARGAHFEDDRALERLADKLSDVLGRRAGIRI